MLFSLSLSFSLFSARFRGDISWWRHWFIIINNRITDLQIITIITVTSIDLLCRNGAHTQREWQRFQHCVGLGANANPVGTMQTHIQSARTTRFHCETTEIQIETDAQSKQSYRCRRCVNRQCIQRNHNVSTEYRKYFHSPCHDSTHTHAFACAFVFASFRFVLCFLQQFF